MKILLNSSLVSQMRNRLIKAALCDFRRQLPTFSNFFCMLICVIAIAFPGYLKSETNRFCDGFEATSCRGLILDLTKVWPKPGAKESTTNPDDPNFFRPTHVFAKLPEAYWNNKTRLLLDGVDITPNLFKIENGVLTGLVDRVGEGIHHVEVKAGSETAGWSFTAGDPPPYLGIIVPGRSVAGLVKINIEFNDTAVFGGYSSGIDLASLSVKLNGVDVTESGTITPNSFSLSKLLASGDYEISATVADKLGYVQTKLSFFSIGPTPELSNCTSGNFEFAKPPVIACEVKDVSSEIDVSSVKVLLRKNSGDLVLGTTKYISTSPSQGRFFFIPNQPLATDIYHFEATIKNVLGVEMGVLTPIFIGKKRESSVTFVSPIAGQVFEDPRIVVRIIAKNWESFAETVKINGQVAAPKIVNNEVEFETELLLNPGSNNINAEVLFKNGEMHADSIKVVYDAAP